MVQDAADYTDAQNTYEDDGYIKNNNIYDKGGEVNLTPWKALNNIEYTAIPDTTFTRDKTGAGSIEYFSSQHPEGIIYPNGYHRKHPIPGKDVILYNPNENDE